MFVTGPDFNDTLFHLAELFFLFLELLQVLIILLRVDLIEHLFVLCLIMVIGI